MKRINLNNEQGRSMVEMLGTLAIVGVLSVGAIGGYSYAMNKHRTNELIYEATKRAQWVGTQLEMNNPNPSINTFGNDSLGGGRFTGQVLQLENGQIGIAVADLKEAVCDAIKDEIGDNTVIRAIKNTDATGDVVCDEGVTATLVFNRDLSADNLQNIGENDGNSENESQNEQNEDPCNGHGTWDGSSCLCDPNWGATNCSVDKSCNGHGTWDDGYGFCFCSSTWGGNDCSIENACNGHGYWISYEGGRCVCDQGWVRNNCSQTSREACNNHGSFHEHGCTCDNGWGGYDCLQDPNTACGEHGSWTGNAYCRCDIGWYGSVCSYQSERAVCAEHGVWHAASSYINGGFCECDSGYSGSDCSTPN